MRSCAMSIHISTLSGTLLKTTEASQMSHTDAGSCVAIPPRLCPPSSVVARVKKFASQLPTQHGRLFRPLRFVSINMLPTRRRANCLVARRSMIVRNAGNCLERDRVNGGTSCVKRIFNCWQYIRFALESTYLIVRHFWTSNLDGHCVIHRLEGKSGQPMGNKDNASSIAPANRYRIIYQGRRTADHSELIADAIEPNPASEAARSIYGKNCLPLIALANSTS